MPKPSFAVTRRVNPPGAEPVLTHEQVWKGLEIKSREPLKFVTIMTSSKVTEEDGNKLTRYVSFNNAPEVREDVEFHEPTIAYFEIETGHRITNLISYNEDGEMLLTFSFANGVPTFPDDAPLPPLEERNQKLGAVVQHTINRFREMAKEGQL